MTASGVSASESFEMALLDPCSESYVELVASYMPQARYTLGEPAMSYEHDPFTVSPSFCPVVYEYSWDTLDG